MSPATQPLAATQQVGCMGVQTLGELQPVNAPIRAEAEPLLDDFPYRLSDNVRFADLDINQHVNNASYAS